ncbi:MAG: DUF5058 family protein, partial [Eggerthellaceae bacterium]|nr:DUF5058 family protein [Eggerthellaceae bacterium]
NSPVMYLIVGVVILFVAATCVVFMVRAYRAGERMGIDKVRMKRAVSASATFAVLPSVGILVGVIALAGSLGIPLPWLRLSVIGALHYETQVAQVAAEQTGIQLSSTQMTEQAFVTIAFLMAFCICWGMVFSIIFTKRYAKKLMVQQGDGGAAAALADKPASGDAGDNVMAATAVAVAEPDAAAIAAAGGDTFVKETAGKKKKGKFSISSFGDIAMNAMFIGLVSAYIGSYIGDIKADANWLPLAVALVGAAAMAGFIWLKEKRHADWVDNFSVAGSMIIAMASAILFASFM